MHRTESLNRSNNYQSDSAPEALRNNGPFEEYGESKADETAEHDDIKDEKEGPGQEPQYEQNLYNQETGTQRNVTETFAPFFGSLVTNDPDQRPREESSSDSDTHNPDPRYWLVLNNAHRGEECDEPQ